MQGKTWVTLRHAIARAHAHLRRYLSITALSAAAKASRTDACRAHWHMGGVLSLCGALPPPTVHADNRRAMVTAGLRPQPPGVVGVISTRRPTKFDQIWPMLGTSSRNPTTFGQPWPNRVTIWSNLACRTHCTSAPRNMCEQFWGNLPACPPLLTNFVRISGDVRPQTHEPRSQIGQVLSNLAGRRVEITPSLAGALAAKSRRTRRIRRSCSRSTQYRSPGSNRMSSFLSFTPLPRSLPNLGQHQARFGHFRANCGRVRSSSPELWPNSAVEFGPTKTLRATFARLRPNLA